MNPILNVTAKQPVVKPQVNQHVQRIVNKGVEIYRNQLRANMNYFDRNESNNLFVRSAVKTKGVDNLEKNLKMLLLPEGLSSDAAMKLKSRLIESLDKLVKTGEINPNEYGYACAWIEASLFVKTNLKNKEEIDLAIKKIFPTVQKEFGDEIVKIQTLPYRNIGLVSEKILENDLKMDRCEQEILDQIIEGALKDGRVYMNDENFKKYNELVAQLKSGKITKEEFSPKRRRLLIDSLEGGYVNLTKQEKTKYNKLVTKFNKLVRSQKQYIDSFHYMKGMNLIHGVNEGFGDFIKQYGYFPYRIKSGNKKFPFYGNVYWLSQKRNLMVLDNPDLTERLFVDGNCRLKSRRTADARGVYTTEVYNEAGDVVQISKYDHRTHKQKVIKKK